MADNLITLSFHCIHRYRYTYISNHHVGNINMYNFIYQLSFNGTELHTKTPKNIYNINIC